MADSKNSFRPQLRFVVEVDGGEVVDASLSPSTKETLQRLVGQGYVGARRTCLGQSQSPEQSPEQQRHGSFDFPINDNIKSSNLVCIEVPLKNNDEFFQMLQFKLIGLNTLHDQEKTALVHDIADLGRLVSRVAAPSRILQHTDLYAWRAIFELYLGCSVYFSTSENESFNRTPSDVQRQLQLFSSRLSDIQRSTPFRRRDSNAALQQFLLINANLLRNLKFQQLNVRAAGKILKSQLPLIVALYN
ncbi:MAG: hypothetical protein Q9170_002545 [Blastenia crenularia]